EARPAGLLHLVGGRVRRQGASQHALAGQVEVPAALEDAARGHLAHALPLKREAADEAVERGREHVLVGGARVLVVAASERDPVATQDDGPARVPPAHAGAPSSIRSRMAATLGSSSPISAIAVRLASPPGSAMGAASI